MPLSALPEAPGCGSRTCACRSPERGLQAINLAGGRRRRGATPGGAVVRARTGDSSTRTTARGLVRRGFAAAGPSGEVGQLNAQDRRLMKLSRRECSELLVGQHCRASTMESIACRDTLAIASSGGRWIMPPYAEASEVFEGQRETSRDPRSAGAVSARQAKPAA